MKEIFLQVSSIFINSILSIYYITSMDLQKPTFQELMYLGQEKDINEFNQML